MKLPKLQIITRFIWENLIYPIKIILTRIGGSIKHFSLSPKKESFVYVALGDSTVEGLGASNKERTVPSLIHKALSLKYPKAEYYNLGRAGATIQDLIDSQLETAISLNPDFITISIGANDIFHQTQLKKFEERIDYVLWQLKWKTSSQVLINNVPDFSAARVYSKWIRIYGNMRVKLLNKIIRKWANKHNCLYVDLYFQSKIFSQNYPEIISDDGLHPSDTGYAIWANTIISSISKEFLSL